MKVEPEGVGVDPDGLGEAVAFIEAELEKGVFRGAVLAATRHRKLLGIGISFLT